MINLDEIERLAKAATPGPWWADITNGPGAAVCRSEEVRAHGHFNVCRKAGDSPAKDWIKNAQYIAAANPESVLALCAELRRLRAIADKINAALAAEEERIGTYAKDRGLILPLDGSLMPYKP